MDQYIFYDMTFTWLDGVMLNTDGGTLFGPVPRGLWGRYYPYNENNQIPSTTDPILVQYKDKNLLIDTSFNLEKLNEKTLKNLGIYSDGDIADSLFKLNLTPADIDIVMMTHMHNDHASGLTHFKNNELESTYPNAEIYVHTTEWDDARQPE